MAEYLSDKKALAAFSKPGARLILTHGNANYDPKYYVLPGGRVTKPVAMQLLSRFATEEFDDGLFRDNPQIVEDHSGMRISRGVINFRTIPQFGVEVIDISLGNVSRSIAVSHAFDCAARGFDHIPIAKVLRELASQIERQT